MKIRILYIEDDSSQRAELARLLSKKNYKVDPVASGKAGLDFLAGNMPDVVLCDLNMPDMSGLQVLEQVKQQQPDLPFIVLTGHGTVPQAVKAMNLGADDFLLKPPEIAKMDTTIRNVIEKKRLESALRQSETNFRLILENIPDIIYSLDTHGRFLNLGPDDRTVLGYRVNSLIGRSFLEIVHPDDQAMVQQRFERLMTNPIEQVRTAEFRMLTKSGEARFFEVKGRSVVEQGKVIKTDGIARDVTERKQLEEQLKQYSIELEQRVQERTQSLEYVNRQLTALNAVSNHFSQIFDEEILFECIPELLTSSLDFDRALFFLVEDNHFELKSFCCLKDPPAFVDFVREKSAAGEMPSYFQESYRANKTIINPEVQIDPTWPAEIQEAMQLKALIISPIRRKNEPIGLLIASMQYHNRQMEPQDVARFEMFTNMVSLALENIRAYRSLEEQVLERTDSLRLANQKLDEKAREVEQANLQLGKANVELLANKERLEEKNWEMQQLLTQLSQRQMELEAILDVSPNVILMVNNENKVVTVNRSVRDFFGVDIKEILHHSYDEFLQKIEPCFENFARFQQIASKMFFKPKFLRERDFKPDEIYQHGVQIVSPKPRLIFPAYTAVTDQNGHEIGKIWFFNDITNFKKTYEQLQTIVNASPIPLIVSRLSDEKILFVNHNFASLLAMDFTDLNKYHFSDFYFDPHENSRISEKLQQEKSLRNYETRIKRVDGTVFWVVISAELTQISGEAVMITGIYDIDERKMAEEKLRRAHQIYRDAIENVDAVPYLKNAEKGIYEFIGEGVESLLGIPAEALTPGKMARLCVDIVVSDAAAPQNPYEYGKSFLRGEVNHYRVDLKIRMTDGTIKWVSDCSVPVKDESSGRIIGSLGILQDITERKQAEEKLLLYREVFLNSNDGIAVYDPQGTLIDSNPAHFRFFETSAAKSIGQPVSSIMGETASEKVGQVLKAGRSFRGEIDTFSKSGKEVFIDLSVFPVLNEKQETICFAGIGRDITERKQAEAVIADRLRYEEGLAACSQALLRDTDTNTALNDALHFLRQASRSSRVYIFKNFVAQQDGLCMQQTHEVCAPDVTSQICDPMLQFPPYQLGFERWRNNLSQDKPIQGLIEQFPESERKVLSALQIMALLVIPLKVKGEWYGFIGFDDVKHPRQWNEQDIRLLKTAAEMISVFLERRQVLDDLEKTNQHLKETQAQLVQSEKMASLGMLVAGIAHEINTPVGAIRSMHDTLMRATKRLQQTLNTDLSTEIGEDSTISRLLAAIENANKVIHSGTDRVMNIVKRLRSFARLDEAELKTVDLHEGIEDTLTLIHHEIKHDITIIRKFGKIPPIACFPSQLNQVYLNILMNAKQAIRGKGEITITTFLKNNRVHVAITDTGLGIPPDHLSKIFDPGFTTKGVGVGTGLGLSICFKIMQAHRGEIQVKSEVGKGSTFTIIFPANLDKILELT